MTAWRLRRGLSVAGLILTPIALVTGSRVVVWAIIALLASAVAVRALTGWRRVDPP